MAKKKRHKSTLARAEKVKALTKLHYEAGNQAKCYKAVWRHWIEPEFGICYRTYLNMLGLSQEPESRQFELPSLFDEL
ncbi:MAG: hypothetical protein J1E97_07910 [Muribaculaceae bacterium]|nr:hypothetical protein [Muribaculaceae bacterium]